MALGHVVALAHRAALRHMGWHQLGSAQADGELKQRGLARACTCADLASDLAGRPIRVATMCSGTESPLLALDLICKALHKQHGVSLQVEHVFSCEIEPFKQAYIERNFAPPLLFRARPPQPPRARPPCAVVCAVAAHSCITGSCDVVPLMNVFGIHCN